MIRAAQSLLTVVLCVSLCVFVSGCPEQGAAERAGESVDEAIEEVEESVEEAGDAIEDATDGR